MVTVVETEGLWSGYNGVPVHVTGTLPSFTRIDHGRGPLPVTITVSSGTASLAFEGTATDPWGVDGLKGRSVLNAPQPRDIYELAEVVRNLAIREAQKGLSTGEKQMFTRAKKILASELMYALGMDEDEVEDYLQGLLLDSYNGKSGKKGKVAVAAK